MLQARILLSAAPEPAVAKRWIFTCDARSQAEQDVVDERDRQRDEHAEYDPAKPSGKW